MVRDARAPPPFRPPICFHCLDCHRKSLGFVLNSQLISFGFEAEWLWDLYLVSSALSLDAHWMSKQLLLHSNRFPMHCLLISVCFSMHAIWMHIWFPNAFLWNHIWFPMPFRWVHIWFALHFILDSHLNFCALLFYLQRISNAFPFDQLRIPTALL